MPRSLRQIDRERECSGRFDKSAPSMKKEYVRQVEEAKKARNTRTPNCTNCR